MNTRSRGTLYRIIALLAALALLPIGSAGAQRPEPLGPASPFDAEFEATARSEPGVIALSPPIGATMQLGGQRLVDTQYTDGGWGWPLNAPPTYFNIHQPIATGLVKAYEHTGDPNMLAALLLARDKFVAKVDTAAEPDVFRFSPPDGIIAAQLDALLPAPACGATSCTEFVNEYFYESLEAGTYDRNGADTNYDTAEYIDLIQTARAGLGNYAAWDIGLGLVGAASVGSDTTDWIQGVKDELNEFDTSVGYDVFGLAGGLYGLAFVSEPFDPTTGDLALASDLDGIAAVLAGYQLPSGGFGWEDDDVAGEEIVQATAYTILALEQVDRTQFLAAIIWASDYLDAVQLGTGGWENNALVAGETGENNEVTGEALWALNKGYPLGDVWVCESGDCGHPDASYNTIQDGVDNVALGGTVHILAGSYAENVEVDRLVTLAGAGCGTDPDVATIVTSVSASTPTIRITASGADSTHRLILMDLQVTGATGTGGNSGAGIRVDSGGSYMTFDGVCSVDNAGYGIGLNVMGTMTDVQLLNSYMLGNDSPGVKQSSGTSINGLTVTDSHADGNSNGLYLDGPLTGFVLSGGTYDNNQPLPGTDPTNGVGIYATKLGNLAPYSANSLSGFTASGNKRGVIINKAYDEFSITNATISNNLEEGITFAPGANLSGITLSNLTLENNLKSNLWVISYLGFTVDDVTISDSTFTGATGTGGYGVYLYVTGAGSILSDVSVTNSTIANNLTGIYVRAATPGVATGISVTSNAISGNANNGLWISDTAAVPALSVAASGNTFTSNHYQVASTDGTIDIPLTLANNTFDLAVTVEGSWLPFIWSHIQDGVDAASAGNIVHVNPGTYIENVVINKALELSGAGQGSSIVKPALSGPNPCSGASLCPGASNIFLVQANDVLIHHFTLDGDNPALTSAYDVGGANLDARNGIITNHQAGTYNNLEVHHVTVQNIYLRGIYDSTGSFNIHDNTVTNVQAEYASIAMFAWYGPGTFANNTVSYAGDAISANHSKGIQFLNNVVTNSGSGVHTDNAGDGGGVADLLQGNSVSDCTPGGYGVWVFVPYIAPTVDDNTVTNCEVGLSAWGQGAAVTTTFSNNVVDAEGLANSVGAYITTDIIGWGYTDVSVLFTDNVITNNDVGVFLTAEEQSWNPDPYEAKTIDVTFTHNQIAGNTAGVEIEGPNGTLIEDFEENWWGYFLGPDAPDNTYGTGDTVVTGIDYRPWCSNIDCTEFLPPFPIDVTVTSVTPEPSHRGGSTTIVANVVGEYDSYGVPAPVGTVDIGYPGLSPIPACDDLSPDGSGDVSCSYVFPDGSSFALTAAFTPTDSTEYDAGNATYVHKVWAPATDFEDDDISDFAKFDPATGMLDWFGSDSGTWATSVWMGAGPYQYVPRSDFDGDGYTDPAKFDPATNSLWYIESSTASWVGVYMGPGTYEYVAGSDFDGDGKTDPAHFTPGTNVVWYQSSRLGSWVGEYTGPGTYTLVVGSDFDGDGRTDFAQFGTALNAIWWENSSTGIWDGFYMGAGTFDMVEGSDFDGDFISDKAKFDSASNVLWWYGSVAPGWTGVWLGAQPMSYVAAADFDGDNTTDMAFFDDATDLLWWYSSAGAAWMSQDMGAGTYEIVN